MTSFKYDKTLNLVLSNFSGLPEEILSINTDEQSCLDECDSNKNCYIAIISNSSSDKNCKLYKYMIELKTTNGAGPMYIKKSYL